MVEIRPLGEADVGEAQRILRVAFGTFFGVPDPEIFWSDLDYVKGRFGAEHIASFAAEQAGQLVGSNFATRWGSVGYFGPVSVKPELWNAGVAQHLVGAACDALEAWGVRHAGLFTFAESAKHVWTYGKFGFYPRFLTAVMAQPTRTSSEQGWSRYSQLPQTERTETEAAARSLTEQLYAGLDLGGEIRTVVARSLGDLLLLWEGDSQLAGFAICHWGPASEAGDGCLLIKFGAVRPGSGQVQRFARLLDACSNLAGQIGMPNVLAGVSLAREEAYRQMLARGFRTRIQGVTMHRPNEPGYSRAGLFVLDDWR
jgi:GNAT superfamily N-acetyltransferase